MKKTLLLVLTLSVLSARSTSVIREYHYVEMLKTWTDAQSYCREKFTDLATVENQSDNDRLLSELKGLVGDYAWIGLYDNMEGWKWALGNAYEYSNWKIDEPDNKNYNETCTLIQSDGLWIDFPCSSQTPYRAVCYHENSPSKYILVNTKMTWYDARTYCRSNYTDLASVRNLSESNDIASIFTYAGFAWIGLHRHTWAYWSDQTPTTFTNWNQYQPKYIGDAVKSCVAVKPTTGTWWDVGCNVTNYFICQNVYTRQQQQTFKLRFQSEADLTDPALQQQITEQLHAKLEKSGISDFKLGWTLKDGQAFHKEQKKKKDEGSCG